MSIRWMIRAQLQQTGTVRLSDVVHFEVEGEVVHIDLGSAVQDVERALLERLSGTSGEVVFDRSDNTLMLDHVTEFLATRPNG